MVNKLLNIIKKDKKNYKKFNYLKNKNLQNRLIYDHIEFLIDIPYETKLPKTKIIEKVWNKIEEITTEKRSPLVFKPDINLKEYINVILNNVEINSYFYQKIYNLENCLLKVFQNFVNYSLKKFKLIFNENLIPLENFLLEEEIKIVKNPENYKKEDKFTIWLKYLIYDDLLKSFKKSNTSLSKNHSLIEINNIFYEQKPLQFILEECLSFGSMIVFIESILKSPYVKIEDKNWFLKNISHNLDVKNQHKVINSLKRIGKLRNSICHSKTFYNFLKKERKDFVYSRNIKIDRKTFNLKAGKKILFNNDIEININFTIEIINFYNEKTIVEEEILEEIRYIIQYF